MLATASGIISSIEIPARQSMIVELVGRDDLPQAIALNSSGFNLARIVGPALGALIIGKFGIAWAFGARPLSSLFVLAGLYLVRLQAWRPTLQLVRPLDGIRESFVFMRNTPIVAALLKLVTVYSILGVPYLVLMPVYARERLGLDASGYGLLLAWVGIGGLVGALAIAARPARQAGTRTLEWSSYSYPVILIALAVTRDARLAHALLFAAGVTMIINGAVSNALLQHHVPDEMRGRIMAAYSFIVVGLAQTVGALIAGFVARLFGVHWAITIGGLAMFTYAVYAFRRPAFRPLGTAEPREA